MPTAPRGSTHRLRPWRSVSSPSLCRTDSTVSESLGAEAARERNSCDQRTFQGEMESKGIFVL